MDARFVKLPTEHADVWYQLSFWDRALGANLFQKFGNTELIDVPLKSLPDVLCRLLAVDGRDRQSMRRALQRIIKLGLLVAEGDQTRLLYSRKAYAQRTRIKAEVPPNSAPTDTPTDSEPTVNRQSTVSEPTVNRQSNLGKSLKPLKTGPLERKKDREERERESAGASARGQNSTGEGVLDPGANPTQDSAHAPGHLDPDDRTPHQRLCDLVREKHRAWHIGVDPLGQPPRMPQGYGKHVAAIAEGIAPAPDPSARLDLLFAGFERDEWCKGNGYPIGALANNPSRYAKPVSHSFAVPDDSDPSIHDGRDDSPGYRSDERGRACSP